MHPIIIDKNTGKELWISQQCAAYCGITTNAWSNYKSTGRIPEPVAVILGKTPLWDPEEVKLWHSQ
ncbi:hypothetical protein ACFLIN_10565 [Corynebacterium kutscheri]|nr:hypothetical protein [Corynebacterium kutscheri]